MYGCSPLGRRSMLEVIPQRVRAGEPVPLFTDEYRTPADVFCAARGLLRAARSEETLLHLGGAERLSRYEMGEIICRAAGLGTGFLKKSLQSQVRMDADRPADVSLNSEKAFALGYEPRSLAAVAAEVYTGKR